MLHLLMLPTYGFTVNSSYESDYLSTLEKLNEQNPLILERENVQIFMNTMNTIDGRRERTSDFSRKAVDDLYGKHDAPLFMVHTQDGAPDQ
eukprot:scaffold192648_cov22-Tisochrysis_lutea.AAC.1